MFDSPLRATLCLAVLATLACDKAEAPPSTTPEPQSGPQAIAEPDAEPAWPAVPTDLPQYQLAKGEVLTISTAVCASGRWSGALPFGSVWVVVAAEDDSCLIWLGGETENPDYDGEATGLCRVAREQGPSLELVVGNGGPAWIDHDDCSRRPGS